MRPPTSAGRHLKLLWTPISANLSAPGPGSIDIGTPGASARTEYERRHRRREDRIRAEHPRLGKLMLALGEDPQSTRAWQTGAIGEEVLGRRLNELASVRLLVLHDRRIPGSRANIDHLAVTPSGVFVIDAKRYKGRPSLRVEGGVLRPRVEKLMVGGALTTRGVDVVWPKRLYARIAADGPLDDGHIQATHRILAQGLPPA